MTSITFIRPYLYVGSPYKINVSIDGAKMLELYSGGEQTIELDSGKHIVEAGGFLMRTVAQTISLKEGEDKKIYIFFNFASKGKFHEKTFGVFLFKFPLGISEEPYEPSTVSDTGYSLPFFQSALWAACIMLVSLIPAVVEMFTQQNTFNMFFLLSLGIFTFLPGVTMHNFLKKKRFFYTEPYTSFLLLMMLFLFQENIQYPTMLAIQVCAAVLLILFIVKIILNKRFEPPKSGETDAS